MTPSPPQQGQAKLCIPIPAVASGRRLGGSMLRADEEVVVRAAPARTQEPASGKRLPHGLRAHRKRLAGTLPYAAKRAAIEDRDFAWKGRNEVMIPIGVVILDRRGDLAGGSCCTERCNGAGCAKRHAAQDWFQRAMRHRVSRLPFAIRRSRRRFFPKRRAPSCCSFAGGMAMFPDRAVALKTCRRTVTLPYVCLVGVIVSRLNPTRASRPPMAGLKS